MTKVWIGAVLACLCACTTDGSFTPIELRAIRAKLSALPETAPPSPTNAYADDADAAALGRLLFFDPRYSSTGEVSCATCHDPDAGFQDDRANTSTGVAGTTGRHAPTVLNAAIGDGSSEITWQFWDGRVDSLWSQALGPPEDSVEMGSSRTRIALLIYDEYRADYEAIFGTLPAMRDELGDPIAPDNAKPGTAEWDGLDSGLQDDITQIYVNFGKAIGAYERLLISHGSRFDAFWNEIDAGASDSDILSEQEKLGLRVFMSKGACLDCHSGPNLSDWKFYNTGVSQDGANLPSSDDGRSAGIEKVSNWEFNCLSVWSDHPRKDECAIADLDGEVAGRGSFKTPGLRDLQKTAPYMHTGLIKTVREVVEHYDAGGQSSGFAGVVDEKIFPLNLTEEEIAALEAFMESLEGEPLPSSLLAPVQ